MKDNARGFSIYTTQMTINLGTKFSLFLPVVGLLQRLQVAKNDLRDQSVPS